MSISILYVTHENQENAHYFVQKLLKDRWIACGNIFPINSIYHWRGEVEQSDEVVTLLKTRPELLPALLNKIESLHPYEVPCVLHWEVEANPSYMKWIKEETRELPDTQL